MPFDEVVTCLLRRDVSLTAVPTVSLVFCSASSTVRRVRVACRASLRFETSTAWPTKPAPLSYLR
jgi:hypothetical protein